MLHATPMASPVHCLPRVRPFNLSAAGARQLSRLLDRLRQTMASGLARAADTTARWRAERDLHALDDRMLADIGLQRADLPTPRGGHHFAVLDHVQAWDLDFDARPAGRVY
jgi:uncharacterized protein YjiS (DUF1127 family)